MKRKKPAAPALAGAAGFFQGGTQKYTAAVGRNPRGRRALWGYKAIGLHQHRGTAGDAALQPCHPGCPEGPCHDIATGWVIFLPAGRLRCLPCQQPCYGPKNGIVPRPLVLDRGNSDFQVRGSAAGGVILLAPRIRKAAPSALPCPRYRRSAESSAGWRLRAGKAAGPGCGPAWAQFPLYTDTIICKWCSIGVKWNTNIPERP